MDHPKRDKIGTYNGFRYIACGAVESKVVSSKSSLVHKVVSSKSSLVQIDERVLGTFPFANELDAPVLDTVATMFSAMLLVFLFAAVRRIP